VTNVDGHPNEEVLYGDLYEMSAAGVSSGGFIYLFNATGEPFAARDRQVTFNGMKQEFYANAASDGSEADWNFEWFVDHDDVRAIVAGVLPVYSEDD